jgi:oligogalacturonide lyase
MVYVSYQHGSPERWIRALDPVTLADRPLAKMPPCSHLMSNHDGSLIVGDGCGEAASAATGSANAMQSGDPYLHLFDLKTGTSRRIAQHATSWAVYKGNRQVTHPHPSFSPDQKQVLYSSDCDGEPALFLADLEVPPAAA